jgi:hypothetical protein
MGLGIIVAGIIIFVFAVGMLCYGVGCYGVGHSNGVQKMLKMIRNSKTEVRGGKTYIHYDASWV